VYQNLIFIQGKR